VLEVSQSSQGAVVLVKVLVEVAEVRACKASCHIPPALFEFCQEAELLVEVAEVRACKASCHIYPHHLSNFARRS